MSTINDLGFKSALVLAKLGHDLGDRLDGSIEAPIPDAMESKAIEIQNALPDNDEIVLGPNDYKIVDDDPLI